MILTRPFHHMFVVHSSKVRKVTLEYKTDAAFGTAHDSASEGSSWAGQILFACDSFLCFRTIA
jgi:hypothetical protein